MLYIVQRYIGMSTVAALYTLQHWRQNIQYVLAMKKDALAKMCAQFTFRCVFYIWLRTSRVRKSKWSFADVCTVNVCMWTCVCESVYTGFRSQISMEFSLDTRQKICGFRGEQSSKNRKLTHVCWTKWKYFSVVHLMENVCFGFYGWNVFVCSTTVCF